MPKPAAFAALLAAGVALSACASAPVVDKPATPPDYRKLIREKLATVAPAGTQPADVAISSLRAAPRNAPARWSVCLLVRPHGKEPQRYAVFFDDHGIVESRLAVVIDRCESERYGALAAASKRKRR